MNKQPIQVLLVDHHAIVQKGMKALLNEYEDLYLAGVAENSDQALELVERLRPDVVLVDLSIPGNIGVEVIKRIIAIQPTQCIIALDACLGEDLFPAAIKTGAQSCLLKDTQTEYLIQTIRRVHEKKNLHNIENARHSRRLINNSEPIKSSTMEHMEPNVGALCPSA